MPFTLTKKQCALALSFIAAAGLVAALLPSQPQQALAQTCRTVTISSPLNSLSAFADPSNTPVQKSDSQTIDPATHTGSGEYVSEVRILNASVSASVGQECDSNCTAGAVISAESPSSGAESLSASAASADISTTQNDADSGTVTLTMPPETAGETITLSASAEAHAPSESAPGEPTAIRTAEAQAGAGDAELYICDIPEANVAPDANDDGVPTPICAENDVPLDINVVANDEKGNESDVLEITGVNGATVGTAAFTGSFIRYTPSASLSGAEASTNETLSYTITDNNGGSDTAAVNLVVKQACQEGKITLDFGDDPSGAVTPLYDLNADGTVAANETLPTGTGPYWVPIENTGRRVVIKPENITPPEGYRLSDPNEPASDGGFEDIPIQKDPTSINVDITGEPNTAELATSTDVCIAPAPTAVGSCSQASIGSGPGDLLTAGSEAGQCAVTSRPQHDAYVGISDATWVWEAAPVQDATGPETATIQKQFSITDTSDVDSARLTFAADNFYRLSVNGEVVSAERRTSANDAGDVIVDGEPGYNFDAAKTVNIEDALVDGTNTVRLMVTNERYDAASPSQNPAGGIFRVDVDTRVDSCGPANRAPTASAYANPISTDGATHDYQLNAENSYDPDTGDSLTYYWELQSVESDPGGAAQEIYTGLPGSGVTRDVSFSNSREDVTYTYTIKLTVTDEAGATDTATTQVSVTCNDNGGSSCTTNSPN